MEYLIREAFRHNAWATRRLVAFCRDLTPEHLSSTVPATYGSILETLNHVIRWDASYLPRARIEQPAWAEDADVDDLDELDRRIDETERLWEFYFSDPLDPEHLLLLDEGAYEVHASIPVVQALHHANVHREQVCSILTSLGIDAPDLQAWTYAEATGRAQEVRPGDA
jgi:uncharacterized damage-inducible protein DinB